MRKTSTNPRVVRTFGWPILCVASAILLVLIPRHAFAADSSPQNFDIPAGDARTTLSEFSDQASGHGRVLYSAETIKGVKTNAVKGRFVPFQAVTIMVSGTPLEAMQDDHTGAIIIRRRTPSATSIGETNEETVGETEGTNVESGPQEQVVKMSQFEVTTTQGHGYVSTNAATGFKTNQQLMDIPQGDLVVTNDLITDIAYDNATDILQYFGAAALFEGEAVDLRGYLDYIVCLDEMPYVPILEDSAIIDSYEIVKGPAEALYLNTMLNGVILKSTKKPLPFDQDIVTASINEWGLYRATADLTGPIGKIGDAKISYRLVAVYQHGDPYFENMTDNRNVLFPEFQVQYHNTTVRTYYDLQTIHSNTHYDILMPDGDLYTGAGRRVANMPPNDMEEFEEKALYVELLQKMSSNWELKISGMFWNYTGFGPEALPESVDWDNHTETFTNNIDNETLKYWTSLIDVQGHYEFGPSSYEIENRDIFGYGFSQWTERAEYWNTAPFPYPNGQIGGTVTVPFDSAAAINSVVVPPPSAYTAPLPGTGFGERLDTNISAIYWQHSMDVIPGRLSLITGFTWENVQSLSITDISILPWNAVDVPVSQWLHRLGAVMHVTKDISIYALNSTSFTPPPEGVILENGQLPPSEGGIGDELGVKCNFLGGCISGEAAWFKLYTTNVLNLVAGYLPNGIAYAAVVGSSVEEGVDGDLAFQVLPGWQVIGSFYAGHDNDQNNQPIPYSYDNSWGLFTRYDFAKAGSLRGWSIGGGINRVGGRWMDTSGIIYSAYTLPAEFKMQTGTEVDGFLSYQPNKHWLFRVNCTNILNQAYPLAAQAATIIDPSPPRTWTFESSYKF